MGTKRHRIAALWIGGASCALGTGCRSAVTGAGREYPVELKQGETLNVQVTRDDTRITLTNTTARSFGPGTLWINGAFSLPIDGFEIGQTLTFSLADFRNRFDERFRAGGFFATEAPERLVRAQLETDGLMRGFIVVRSPER